MVFPIAPSEPHKAPTFLGAPRLYGFSVDVVVRVHVLVLSVEVVSVVHR